MSHNFEALAKRRAKSSNLRPLLTLLPFLRPYRGKVVLALVALMIASAATLIVPVAVRRVIDHGFNVENAALVNQYFGAMLAVVVVLAVGSAARFYYVTWVGERLVADIRDRLFSHLLSLDPAFYEKNRTGEVVSRLTADTTQIKAALSSTASIALRNVVMFLGAAAMMVVTSLWLSGLVLLALPLIVLPLVLFGQKVRRLSRKAQDTLADSAGMAQERLEAITAVKSNVQEQATERAFATATGSAFSAAARRTWARSILTASIVFISLGSIVAILWFGAKSVMAGTLSAGELGQFVLFAVMAASSLAQLSEVWGEVQLSAGAAERLAEILNETPLIIAPKNPASLPSPPKGTVGFEAVSFSYPTRPNQSALAGMSFSVKAGETVALVGPSGAGKTTVFALIQRFYDPQKGTIRVDAIDIRTADPRELRRRIAVVPQETVIFSGSVLDNIRFGRPEATDDDAKAAARAAHVEEFASQLPNGYDTQVGERGITLSGGQRQRVAIARAILRDAPILLLDEATSALDAESEAFVQNAIEGLTKNRTTLVIAHRLATVRNASRILVLEAGEIVAEGRHASLIKSSPLYARLAKLQFTAPSA
jgi:ATP-binding cassette subfamily B protein